MKKGLKVIGHIDLLNACTKADVTMKREYHRGGNIYFSVPFWITQEKAIELQMELSYHPAGYSFCGFNATPTKTTWYCWNCCD